MATTLNFEPKTLAQGETVTWSRQETDYPASAGWVLTYYLRGRLSGMALEIVGTGSGDTHTFTTEASTTTSKPAGWYQWQLYAAKTGASKLLATGRLELIPNFAAAGPVDTRTQIQKDLDAVGDAIRARLAGKVVAEYEVSIGDSTRKLKYASLDELTKLQEFLIKQRNAEITAERAKNGESAIRPLRVTFK